MSDGINQQLQKSSGRIASDTIQNLSLQAWSTMAAFLKMTRGHNQQNSVNALTFLGDSFSQTASGQSLFLRKGLALNYDPTSGVPFEGSTKPLYSDTEQEVSFSSNLSGLPRIDTLGFKSVSVESNPQQVRSKDALGVVKVETLNSARTLSTTFKVFEGTPSVTPVPGALQDGYLLVCEVLRPSGQATILDSDVTDKRVLDHSEFGSVGVSEIFSKKTDQLVSLLSSSGVKFALKLFSELAKVGISFEDQNGDPAILKYRNSTSGVARISIVGVSATIQYSGGFKTTLVKIATGHWRMELENVSNGIVFSSYKKGGENLIVECSCVSGVVDIWFFNSSGDETDPVNLDVNLLVKLEN